VRLRRGARIGWVAQEAPGGERTPPGGNSYVERATR
jgi:hypothetical protein